MSNTGRYCTLLVMSALMFGCLTSTAESQVPLRDEFFFPQIADGRLDQRGDIKDVFRTVLTLSHPTAAGDPVTGTLTLTLSDLDGNPLPPEELTFRCILAGGTCGAAGEILVPDAMGDLPFEIPAGGILQIMTAREDPSVVQGYGAVVASAPISGMALFGEFEENFRRGNNKVEVEIESQATVEATGRMRKFAITDFRKNKFESEFDDEKFEFESDSSTGVAIVNVGVATSTVTLAELDPSDGAVLDEAEVELLPGEYQTFFFNEVLTNVPPDLVVGTVVFESADEDVTAVAVKFDERRANVAEKSSEFTVAPVMQIE